MKKWKKILLILLAVVAAGYGVFLVALNGMESRENDLALLRETPLFAHEPQVQDWQMIKLKALPPPDENGSVILTHYDLSEADLMNGSDLLYAADFDTATIWPRQLPDGFEPEVLLENGKNPGLGIRALHEQGITGKGVRVAVIDQPLPLYHEQYKDNLVYYEEPYHKYDGAAMHGAAVASALVGKDTGVAPGAELFYIGGHFAIDVPPFGGFAWYPYYASCIDRVLEINEHLPEGEKIRVVAIARGFGVQENGGQAFYDAIERAKEAGVFVITTTPGQNYGFDFMGLGREAGSDPDDIYSYRAGSWWEQDFLNGDAVFTENTILVPMDCRTLAGPTANDDYAYYARGGLSWSVPWVAGLYALCVQADPGITPEGFVRLAWETSDVVEVESEGVRYGLQGIVNPQRLIEAVQERAG